MSRTLTPTSLQFHALNIFTSEGWNPTTHETTRELHGSVTYTIPTADSGPLRHELKLRLTEAQIEAITALIVPGLVATAAEFIAAAGTASPSPDA